MALRRTSALIMLVVLLILSLMISGCDSSGELNGSEEIHEESETEEVADEAGEVTVTDQMGREITFTTVPQRLISLSPSNTEIAFALGLSDRIVGVTEYCNYPPEAQEKEIVGGFSTPNLEKILELEPGLVIASTIHVEEVPRLEEMGIPVLVIESITMVDLFTSISLVSEVAGVPENGEELIASMRERIEAVEAVVGQIPEEDKIKIYYEVYSDPLMSAGSNAFVNEIITLSGGINIFGEINESYPQISAEVVAERMPDMILYPDYHGTADLMEETMAARPGWESVPAVLNGNIYAISDDTFARPGPRVVEAIEEAARLFYPDLF
jgi:iron complex transport system substrate-binding protein